MSSNVVAVAPPRARPTRREVERQRAADRRRIFDVLDGLREDLASVDLDAIDGEFFFRCCHRGFDGIIGTIRDRLRGADDGAVFRAALDLHTSEYRVPLEVALAYLSSDGARLRLRDPDLKVEKRVEGPPDEPIFVPDHIRMKVFSGATTGRDVARMICGADPFPAPRPTDTTVEVRFKFRIVNADPGSLEAKDFHAAGMVFWDVFSDASGHGCRWERRDSPGAPYVEVAAWPPLPSATVIELTYDEEVRRRRGWHKLLLGASAQEPWGALRTWTIALLMKQVDMGFGLAHHAWCQHVGASEDLSSQRYHQERDRLFSRVPEAERFLQKRTQSPIPRPPRTRS